MLFKKRTGKELLERGSGVELCTTPGHGGYPKNICWHCLNANKEIKTEEEPDSFGSLSSSLKTKFNGSI